MEPDDDVEAPAVTADEERATILDTDLFAAMMASRQVLADKKQTRYSSADELWVLESLNKSF